MNTTIRASDPKRRRGAAMIMALALLGLFAVLGAMYVRSMSIELERAQHAVAQARARAIAAGGIQASIADLQATGTAAPHTYAFNTYQQQFTGTQRELVPRENCEATANVTLREDTAPDAAGGKTFHIVSEGRYGATLLTTARVDAVVQLDGAGAAKIVQWNARPGGA